MAVGVAPLLLPLLVQPGLQRGGADAQRGAVEAGLGLAGAVEIAGREGGETLSLEGLGQLHGEPRQLGQHRGVGLVRGRRGGSGSSGFDGTFDHLCIRTKQEQ
ncbi:hypothetical protein [Inquilinus sp. OTU3971]|uniref:hypothetical protein n=1 Tax=Inquilinus sp. OTU3971 TaxID=3043855 RepID=UPI00313B2A32